MGEMSVLVGLEQLDATAMELEDLHRAVWNEIYGEIKRGLPDRANKFTRDDYLSNAASDGLSNGEYSWGRNETCLELSYSGDGDVLVSRTAALHWVEVAYAARLP